LNSQLANAAQKRTSKKHMVCMVNFAELVRRLPNTIRQKSFSSCLREKSEQICW